MRDRSVGLLQLAASVERDLHASTCECAMCRIADRDAGYLVSAITNRYHLGGWAPDEAEEQTLTGCALHVMELRSACIAEPQPEPEPPREVEVAYEGSVIGQWWDAYRAQDPDLQVPTVRAAAQRAGIHGDDLEVWLVDSGWRMESSGRGVPRRWVRDA